MEVDMDITGSKWLLQAVLQAVLSCYRVYKATFKYIRLKHHTGPVTGMYNP